MSGGHFDYAQYRISDIITEIEELIANNNDTSKDRWGDQIGRGYSKETIAEFEKGVKLLKIAQIYAQRIDWLVSGDDGEDSFHQRLKTELSKVDKSGLLNNLKLFIQSVTD